MACLLIGALALAAWAVLATWSAGPHARLLDHGRWLDLPVLGALCASLPNGAFAAALAFHAGAWLLMIAAMMLPTVLPLIDVVVRVTAARSDQAAVVALVVLGYALAWSGFGLVALAVDSGVRFAAAGSPGFAAHGAQLGAAVLGLAGAFQFSRWKYRCLDRCRSPFGFVTARWRGLTPRFEALRIGVAHGAFCIGCCWALMLVTFVVGMSNLGWMLVLAALMAAEKNLPIGRRLAVPVGVGLIGAALVVLAL